MRFGTLFCPEAESDRTCARSHGTKGKSIGASLGTSSIKSTSGASKPRRSSADSTCPAARPSGFLRGVFTASQASLYFISQIGRTRLPGEAVESIEKIIREKMDAVAKELNSGIDGAEALLKSNNVEDIASYDTMPLVMPVPITSALGRRYFEVIHQLDLLMPLLQTLSIEEIISDKQADRQRSRYKRIVMSVKSTTMNWSFQSAQTDVCGRCRARRQQCIGDTSPRRCEGHYRSVAGRHRRGDPHREDFG